MMFDYIVTLLQQLKTAWERRVAEKAKLRAAAEVDDQKLKEALKEVKR